MLEDVELAFKNLNGRQRRKARRMLDRALSRKDADRMDHEMSALIKFIKKAGHESKRKKTMQNTTEESPAKRADESN